MTTAFRFPSPTVIELCAGAAVAMLLLHSIGTLVGLAGVPAIDWTRANARPWLDAVVLITGVVAIVGSTTLLAWAAHNERIALFRRSRPVLQAATLVSVVLAVQMLYRFVGYRAQGLILSPVGGSMEGLAPMDFLLLQLVLRGVLPVGTVVLLLVSYARAGSGSESSDS